MLPAMRIPAWFHTTIEVPRGSLVPRRALVTTGRTGEAAFLVIRLPVFQHWRVDQPFDIDEIHWRWQQLHLTWLENRGWALLYLDTEEEPTVRWSRIARCAEQGGE